MTENQLRYLAHQESVRHNQAAEELSRVDLAEKSRHNVVTENEAGRHNLATEADTDVAQAETERANRTREAETAYHNRVQEVYGAFDTLGNFQRNTADAQKKRIETVGSLADVLIDAAKLGLL